MVGRVIVADEPLASGNSNRGVQTDIFLGFEKRERGNRSRPTGDVAAMRRFQVSIRDIVVSDKGEFVGTDSQGTVLTDIPIAVESGERGRGTGDIGAVRNFQIPVRGVMVRDEAQVIASGGDGGVPTDISGAVQRTDRRGGARLVGAVGDLQVAVDGIIVADESQPVGPDGHGAVLTGIARAIPGNNREARSLKSSVIRLCREDQVPSRRRHDEDEESDPQSYRFRARSALHEAPVGYSLNHGGRKRQEGELLGRILLITLLELTLQTTLRDLLRFLDLRWSHV